MDKERSDAGFDRWWNDEGSGIAPKMDEDHCFHVARVARIAWDNGAFVASTRSDPVAALEQQLAEYRDRAWRAESQLTIRVARNIIRAGCVNAASRSRLPRRSAGTTRHERGPAMKN
jgi:hypothetical protein